MKHRKMKVMISYPPLVGKGNPKLSQNRQFQWYHVPSFIYPLVPAMAATLLERDLFDVLWNDCVAERMGPEDFERLIRTEKPDIIAFETKTPVIKQHWKIIDQIKRNDPECRVVLMGDHVTALPLESMLNCSVDFVITGGDYDVSLLGIGRYVRGDGSELPKGVWYRRDGQVKQTGTFELSHNLNHLPWINRTLTKAHFYGEKWKKRVPFFYTMAGRDCPWGRCTFCAWTVMYDRFRVRSPDHVLDEIGFLIEEHGAKEVFDDTGTFPAGDWLRRFCRGMIERGYNSDILFSANMRYGFLTPDLIALMKKAGFRKLKIGLESANQKTLDRINKGITVQDILDDSRIISSEGIDIHLTVMVGYPWETREDVQRTLDLAKKLMCEGHAEMLQATIVIPYPGTSLHNLALQEGWFRFDPTQYDRYDMSEPVLRTPDMSAEDVVGICRNVYETFLSPTYIWRHVRAVRSWSDVAYIAKGARSVLGHIMDFARIRT